MQTVRSRLAAVAAAAAVALSLTVVGGQAAAEPDPGPGDGCPGKGHYEVCFTDPGPNPDKDKRHKDRKIINKLRDLVAATDTGDELRIAMFGWNLTGITHDVLKARNRGVDVRVIGGKNVAKHDRTLLRRMNTSPRNQRFELCKHSCVGGTSHGSHIMHNKFFLINHNGTKSVVQTSFNLTANQLKLYNNMVRITGDAKLYKFYHHYFHRMWEHKKPQGKDDLRQLGSLRTKGYVFPREKGDPVLGILNNVTKCRRGDKKIWVAESLFTEGRKDVRNRLAQMEDKLGCNVKVIVAKGRHERTQEQYVQAKTPLGNLKNRKVRTLPVHHKFLLIDAKYNGRWQQVVLTGSHNQTLGSLQQDDEAMVRVRDPFVFKQYRHQYDAMFSAASGG